VVTHNGIAVHVVAAVTGAKDNFREFRESLGAWEELEMPNHGEPCLILADKGHIGNMGSQSVVSVIPQKPAASDYFSQGARPEKAVLEGNRVIVENFFGRLMGKCRVDRFPGPKLPLNETFNVLSRRLKKNN
jgi:hypothetical protein